MKATIIPRRRDKKQLHLNDPTKVDTIEQRWEVGQGLDTHDIDKEDKMINHRSRSYSLAEVLTNQVKALTNYHQIDWTSKCYNF